MSADDARHTTEPAPLSGPTPHGSIVPTELHTVAARVPAEYREAYLEGFALARADRDDVPAAKAGTAA